MKRSFAAFIAAATVFALHLNAAAAGELALEGPRADALREASLLLLVQDPRRTLFVLNSLEVRVTKGEGVVDILFRPRPAYRAHPVVGEFHIRLRRKVTLSPNDAGYPDYPAVVEMPGRYAAALVSVFEYRRHSRIATSANGVRLNSPATSVRFNVRTDGSIEIALAETLPPDGTAIHCFKREAYSIDPSTYAVHALAQCTE